MAKYTTHKRTSQGRAQTLARRTQRSVKYAGATRVSAAGRAR